MKREGRARATGADQGDLAVPRAAGAATSSAARPKLGQSSRNNRPLLGQRPFPEARGDSPPTRPATEMGGAAREGAVGEQPLARRPSRPGTDQTEVVSTAFRTWAPARRPGIRRASMVLPRRAVRPGAPVADRGAISNARLQLPCPRTSDRFQHGVALAAAGGRRRAESSPRNHLTPRRRGLGRRRPGAFDECPFRPLGSGPMMRRCPHCARAARRGRNASDGSTFA